MDKQQNSAAQYIRMSTDRQDLSPIIQREAISAFAVLNGYSIVESYEDHGKSGVHLSNRPSLLKLLRDVANNAHFSHVLVYDVSRWGRFQDADAAAYYEYHCRLHDVQVVYVGESFSNDQTPGSVLLKSMKRLMAAEYSRDLATKSRAGQHRVISMGFHMGPLPAFGYRRCSVSSDGKRRIMLEHGQLKVALTDRVEWVLAPEAEVNLVRRICAAYADNKLDMGQIANLVRSEGWVSQKKKPVSTLTIRKLIVNEALIGNFVWGVTDTHRRIVKTLPTRLDGSVPRIIDNKTWLSMQKRLADAKASEQMRAKHPLHPREAWNPAKKVDLTSAVSAGPGQEPQPDTYDHGGTSYLRAFGTRRQLDCQAKEFGVGLAVALSEAGFPAGFDPRFRMVSFWNLSVRIQLSWPVDELQWRIGRIQAVHRVAYVLVVRMVGAYEPLDYLLMTERFALKHLPRIIGSKIPGSCKPFHFVSPEQLVSRLAAVAAMRQPQVSLP